MTRVPAGSVDAVAIVFKHGPAAPTVEQRVASIVGRAHPGLHVSVGHRIDPEVGLLARVHTTLVDAAITPVLRTALLRDRLPPGALAMRSDGSLGGYLGGTAAKAALLELEHAA